VLVLGVSAGFHDSAAAVVVDGVLVSAVEQERLSRVKHDARFPGAAMDTALAVAGATPADVDLVVLHERPVAVLDRYVATRLRTGPTAPRSLLVDLPRVVRTQMGAPRRVGRWFADRGCRTPPLAYSEHHQSHAAAAFYPSPFEQAAVLTLDGVGEWATALTARGAGSDLHVLSQVDFPDSVGLFYSALTEYCGFRPNSGEGELMGLAPFGEPRFAELLMDKVVDVGPDGALRLDLRYFAFLRGRRSTSRAFHELLGGPPRPRGDVPGQREADLAASAQVVLEEVVLRSARHLHEETGLDAVCLAGGVALNCVANGRLRAEGPFRDVWVQPAAGDSGAALGAALWGAYQVGGAEREVLLPDAMAGAFLGPSFSGAEVRSWLDAEQVDYRVEPDTEALVEQVADRLADGAVVGWFCGRMEFGPRALGHRSILADPRSPTVQARLNGLVKERAAFRPFAPAVLAEYADDWFEAAGDLAYMTATVQVRDQHHRAVEDDGAVTLEEQVQQVRSVIPAVTHVDHSARLQTVAADRNPEFTRLLRAFHRRTGCPVLLNTSFNARDEPVVCTPQDALATFRRTGLDLLVVEDCLVEAAR
jgi:carbamoyltransferase